MTSAATPAAAAEPHPPPTFTPITAADFVQHLDPGWNLGNTLDAVPDEGSWNNRPVDASTLDAVRRAGFRSVRIPVTYADHYVGEDLEKWTIDPRWLARVREVVDMAVARGFWVITNVHHDSWKWADLTKQQQQQQQQQQENPPERVYAQFYATWVQIAAALKDCPETVAFESINEPPAETAEDGARVNELNRLFLEAINAAPPAENGFNPQRVVNLVGGMEDPKKTVDWFVPPAVITNPWALQFHYYWPYNYIFSAWGKTTWGSAEDQRQVDADLKMVRSALPTSVPIVLGEFSASPINCERAARWRYLDYLLRAARGLGMAPMMWDNGLDNFDRARQVWRDLTSLQIILGAGRDGICNSLPGGTVDERAAAQESSAFIYQKVGQPVEKRTLPFLLNGNHIVRVDGPDSASPLDAADYKIDGDKVTFSAALLKKYFVGDPGTKAVMTVVFSGGGIALPVELVLWDTPAIALSSFDPTFCDADLKVPVRYRGFATVAAVKMVLLRGGNDDGSDGGVDGGDAAFDEWTKHLGPLQQGRATFEKQWKFDESHVIITAAALNLIAATGRTAQVTFEFYPRVSDNTVSLTLTSRSLAKKEGFLQSAADEAPDAKADCCAVS